MDPLAPSAEAATEILKQLNQYNTPIKEFTDERIKELINDFAKATELSIKAGFDGIELILFSKF